MKSINKIFSYPRYYFLRKGYYARDGYYQKLADKYTSLSVYRNLSNSLHVKSSLPTSNEISLLNEIKFITTGKSDILSRFGKPGYQCMLEDCSLKIEILFYRLMIGKYKAKHELHLCKNELFYYNYSFSYLSDHDKCETLKILEKKYLNENTFDYENSFIVDRNQSAILIEESVDFKIHYFNCASDAMNRITANWEKQNLINIEKEQKEELFKRL